MSLHLGSLHAGARSTAPATFAISALACRKEHARGAACAYQVAWSINPHMRVGAVSWRRALVQHRALRRALRAARARLVELPFVHGAFDCVFTKDNALLVASRALLASMRHGERRAEQRARAEVLAAHGFEVLPPPRAHLEGGDVAVLPGTRGALLGWGQRSERAAAAHLEDFLGAPVLPLQLCDARLYHLDMALCVLSDGTALVCREALHPASWRALERCAAIRQLLEVPREEALGFGLNLVEVGSTVLMGGAAPRVAALLQRLGRTPVHVPLEQFHLAGGSAACLVSRVHPAPVLSRTLPQTRTTSPTTAMRSTSAYAGCSSSSPNTSGSSSS